MSPEEFKKLEAELNKAREKHHADFVAWYDTANYASIQGLCETAWLLWNYVAPKE
jgi:hypothetical protein